MAELLNPNVDFSALGQLPQVYQKAQAEQLRERTLASLGQGGQADVNALLKSGDLSLAQLGVNMKNRQSDDAWRREEASRTQRNADRSYGLQERQFNASNEGPEETAAQRAAAAKSYGLTPDNPAFKPF